MHLGKYLFKIEVTDASGNTTIDDGFTLIITNVSLSTSLIVDSGSSTATGTVTGGSGTYDITWYVNGTLANNTQTPCTLVFQDNGNTTGTSNITLTRGQVYSSSSGTNGCSYNLTDGTYNIKFAATDAENSSDSNYSTATLVVDWSVTVLPSSNTISLDQSATFTAHFNSHDDSNPPYTWSWTSTNPSDLTIPSSCDASTTNSSICTITPNVDTHSPYTITATAKNKVGSTSSDTATLTVKDALTTVLTANILSIRPGQSVKFTNTTSGGTGSNKYKMSFSPSTGVTHVSDGIWSFADAGNYLVTLSVNDTSGETASNAVMITVSYPKLTTQLNANWTYISTGQLVKFTNTTSGGSGGDTYVLSFNPSTGVTHTSDGKYTFANAGNYLATLTVTDSLDDVATNSVNIQVTPPLETTLTANKTHIINVAITPQANKVLFSNTTTGGTGNNKFHYTLNNSAGVTQTGNLFTFTIAGTYLVTLHVNDTTSEVNQSSSIIYVNETLQINQSNIQCYDADCVFSRDQVIKITDSGVTGGVPPYTYQWKEMLPSSSTLINAVDCGAGDSASIGIVVPCTFTPSPTSPLGQYEFLLKAVDSELPPQTAYENAQYLTLNASLTTTLSVGRNLISIGQQVHLSNITQYGTGGTVYSYSVTGGPSGGATLGTTDNYTFTKPGTYTVTLNVHDQAGETNSSSQTITVTPPLETTLTANWTYISAGQSVKFSNSTTGGTGGTTYTYTLNPEGCAATTNGKNTFNFPEQVNCNVILKVTDLTGEVNQSNVSITVTPPLEMTSFSNSTGKISADQAVYFSNSTTGGTGGDVWVYFVNGEAVTPNANGSISFHSAGTYTVSLGVKDATGETANATDEQQITVTPPLETTLTANWTYISAGQSVKFSNSTSGGTGGTTYTYTLNPEGCAATTNGKNTFNFPEQVNCNVILKVTDLSGEVNQSNVSITVTPPLEMTSFSNSTGKISADQAVYFSNSTTGGTGGDVWVYFVNGEAVTPNANGSISFHSAGTYTVSLGVKDATGETANATDEQQITVTPPLETTLTANWTYISAGQSVKFSNSTSGGTGGTTYTYTLNPEGCAATTNGKNTFNFPEQVNCNVILKVTDLSGEVNQSNVSITVTPPLEMTSFSNSTGKISADQAVYFSNSTTGGTGGDVWVYFVNGEAVTPNANGSISFHSAGTYTVSLGVKDATGETANATDEQQITVTPPLETTLTANRTLISTGQYIKFTNPRLRLHCKLRKHVLSLLFPGPQDDEERAVFMEKDFLDRAEQDVDAFLLGQPSDESVQGKPVFAVPGDVEALCQGLATLPTPARSPVDGSNLTPSADRSGNAGPQGVGSIPFVVPGKRDAALPAGPAEASAHLVFFFRKQLPRVLL